jgi:predicted enzyme related to lactoylglutathione lyase
MNYQTFRPHSDLESPVKCYLDLKGACRYEFSKATYGSDYQPSAHGTIVYLNGGDELHEVAANIEANGGTIIVAKTEIGSEMGFLGHVY